MKDKQAILKGLVKGVAEEKEHKLPFKLTKKLAADHVKKDPKYYDKLEKMEND